MGLLKLSPAQEAIRAWVQPKQREVTKEEAATGTLPGLANLGNTCFANSVLQCLLNTPGWFPEVCLSFSHFENSTQSKKAALGRSFQNLALEYGSTCGTSLPRTNPALRNLKSAIAAIEPQYAGCEQQDAYEFLGCVLEALEEGFGALFRGPVAIGDEGAATAKGPSADVIRAICGVTSHTRRECHRCVGLFEVDKVTDTALRLPLLSPQAQFDPALRQKEEQTPVTLQELLDLSRRPETIEGYDCDACRAAAKERGEDHVRSTITQHAGVISATRDVLIVVLYRFGHALDASGNFRPTKVRRQVAFPTDLSVETGRYRLFGVVSHMGATLSAGHYVAAVRSRRDDMWYECNDEIIKPLNMKALYDGRSITSVKEGAEPYILFYHRHPADVAPALPAAIPTPAIPQLVAPLAAPAVAAPVMVAAPVVRQVVLAKPAVVVAAPVATAPIVAAKVVAAPAATVVAAPAATVVTATATAATAPTLEAASVGASELSSSAESPSSGSDLGAGASPHDAANSTGVLAAAGGDDGNVPDGDMEDAGDAAMEPQTAPTPASTTGTASPAGEPWVLLAEGKLAESSMEKMEESSPSPDSGDSTASGGKSGSSPGSLQISPATTTTLTAPPDDSSSSSASSSSSSSPPSPSGRPSAVELPARSVRRRLSSGKRLSGERGLRNTTGCLGATEPLFRRAFRRGYEFIADWTPTARSGEGPSMLNEHPDLQWP